uniref:Uncharacterized protein n=1 Tax=Romanomermis culicivorax TaxID=13658 RepID=A0A915JCB0_ROMCU
MKTEVALQDALIQLLQQAPISMATETIVDTVNVNHFEHCLLGEFFSYFFSSTTVVEINESMNERLTIFDSVQI